MPRWASVRTVVVAVAALAACMPGTVARSQDATDMATCGVGDAAEQAMGTLAVTVQVVGGGGAQPPRDATPTGPQALGAGAGLTVEAVDYEPSGTVVAEGVTDAQGQVALVVPPGRYWLVVPAAGQTPGALPAGALNMELPSGTHVHAYQDATVGAGETVQVALTIRIMLP